MDGVPRLIVLITASGSNLQALINATQDGSLRAEIALVVSNRRDAYGLERARLAGIETLSFPLKPYSIAGESREDYDADLAEILKQYKPDLIVLAGWMHVLGPAFLVQFPRQIIKLHRSLPGPFDGGEAVDRLYDALLTGDIDHAGCTVHYAVSDVDVGPVVAQTIVTLNDGESLGDLELRMRAAEHQLIVQAAQRALTETSEKGS